MPVSFSLRRERVDPWERNASRGDRPFHPNLINENGALLPTMTGEIGLGVANKID
jgi:hypothetical protein